MMTGGREPLPLDNLIGDDYDDTVVGYGGSVMTGRQGRLAGREEREEEEEEAAAPLARLPASNPSPDAQPVDQLQPI